MTDRTGVGRNEISIQNVKKGVGFENKQKPKEKQSRKNGDKLERERERAWREDFSSSFGQRLLTGTIVQWDQARHE